MISPTSSPKARDEPLISTAARGNDDDDGQITISRTVLLTSQSDAVNNKDAYETAHTGSSSIERLENELRRARVVYESAYAKQVMLQTEDTTFSSTAATDDTNITNNQDIEQCVETTNNMHKEMELAKKEMLEASLRAEDFLADLQLLQDDSEDKAGITEQELDIISSPTGVAGLNIHAKHDTSTVSLDMKSLLRDIKDLKLHVKAAKEEVAELRSSINFQSDMSNRENQVNKTHRRVHSTSTSQTVPTEVECAIENTSNSYQPNHEDIWHRTYVDQHLHVFNGFNDTSTRDFDANWWKGSIDNNDEDMCGSEPCVFGGLVKLLKRRDEDSRRDILT